jgi:O-antigen ligase
LRCFSILSDAAQFGASQAHAAFVFGLFGITSSISQPKRYFYLTTAVFAFLGLLVSGTRGAFFILIAGFSVYTLLSGRWKILVVGIITLATIYAFLNYTNIGDSFYAMRRLRTAFNTEDPSLLIRLERIESLKVFMADKPFGFGIGTSGLVGQKYYPNGPEILKWTDGHYINIWMQMGIFGLVSKLLVYLSIVIFSCIRILKMRLSNNRNIATILLCGFCGFIVSDFTNDHTTQLPTSIILPITLGIISLLTRKDNKKESEYFIEK